MGNHVPDLSMHVNNMSAVNETVRRFWSNTSSSEPVPVGVMTAAKRTDTAVININNQDPEVNSNESCRTDRDNNIFPTTPVADEDPDNNDDI